VTEIRFLVQEAGCPSCARRLEDALAPLADEVEIEIDEDADLAAVRLVAPSDLAVEDVSRVLETASAGSGHTYRLQPGSWT